MDSLNLQLGILHPPGEIDFDSTEGRDNMQLLNKDVHGLFRSDSYSVLNLRLNLDSFNSF